MGAVSAELPEQQPKAETVNPAIVQIHPFPHLNPNPLLAVLQGSLPPSLQDDQQQPGGQEGSHGVSEFQPSAVQQVVHHRHPLRNIRQLNGLRGEVH